MLRCKVWFFGFFYNDAVCFLFAKGDFDDLADKKWGVGCISKRIICFVEGFGGRYQIIIHDYILQEKTKCQVL